MKIYTKETKTWKFNELTEDQKQKAIQNLYDINVDCDWWDSVYDDAAQIGLKITGFDIGRGAYCKADFISSAEETANLIIENHGEDCETYKTAADYLQSRKELVEKYSDGKTLDIVAEDNEYEFDEECDDLDNDFLRSICEDYHIILSKEYDYLTSVEAIIETIEANDYDFTEDGQIYY